MTAVIGTLAENIKTHKLVWSTAETHYAVTDADLANFANDIVNECVKAINPALRDMISRGRACDLIQQHFASKVSVTVTVAQPTEMRLMLGHTGLGQPSLLVDVMSDYDPSNFNFFVVNGLWYGSFHDGDIRVNDKYNHDVVANCEILCSDQDRLRGNYNDVFNNFHNVNYCAPVPATRPVAFDDMDDDIPF